MLLGGAPAVVERRRPLIGRAAIGDDEADGREKFAGMKLDLGHNPADLRPTLRPVVKTGVEAHDMVWRPTGAALCQMIDPFVQLGVAFEPDGIIPAEETRPCFTRRVLPPNPRSIIAKSLMKIVITYMRVAKSLSIWDIRSREEATGAVTGASVAG